MAKVSIILPAREEREFLQRTIDDLIAKAAGDIEVIPVLDGWAPNPPLKLHPQVKPISWSRVRGLRNAINAGMSIASGEYVMKLDAHCCMSLGYDRILQDTCEDNWIVVPTKYSLERETWQPYRDGWSHFYLTYPWDLVINHQGLQDKACSRDVHKRYEHEKIADIVTYQGSCYFMTKQHWDKRVGPMDAEHYGLAQEAQETGLRTWLGGGRCIVNKNVHYGHLWKGSSPDTKRGFPRMKGEWIRAHQYAADYWFHDRWPQRTRDFKWLVEKFWDVLKAQGVIGGWPDDWQNPAYEVARKAQDAANANGYTLLEFEEPEPVAVQQESAVVQQASPVVQQAPAVIVPVVSDSLQAILAKYQLALNGHVPIEIKGMVRDDLPALFKSLGFTRGAEIGVWRAEFTAKFCKAGLHMTGVDAWIGYPEYRDHRRPHKIASAYDSAVAALAPYPHQIIRKFSVDAAKDVPDGSLDFIYVDANHSFFSVVQDLTVWTPKVRKGGIISGHDYDVFPRDTQFIHVREAVEGFTAAHGITPWFVLGRRKVRPNEPHEFPRSYMWVQP